MAFCTKCGATLEPDAQFCPNCGTPVETAQASTSPPPMSTPPPAWSSPPMAPSTSQAPPVMSMSRPTGVTILAVLAILSGLALMVFGAITAIAGVGLVFIVFGLIEFAVAYGFWTGKSWGWWLGVIGAVLGILSIVVLDVFGLIIGIIMLYYLTRPHIRMWFHRL